MHVSLTHKWCKKIMQQNLLKRDRNSPLCCGRWCVLGAIFYYYVYPVNKCETSLYFVVSLAITNPLSALPLSLFCSLTAALQVSISLNKVELSVGESKFFICTGTQMAWHPPHLHELFFLNFSILFLWDFFSPPLALCDVMSAEWEPIRRKVGFKRKHNLISVCLCWSFVPVTLIISGPDRSNTPFCLCNV